jgi:hypothetical protein
VNRQGVEDGPMRRVQTVDGSPGEFGLNEPVRPVFQKGSEEEDVFRIGHGVPFVPEGFYSMSNQMSKKECMEG